PISKSQVYSELSRLEQMGYLEGTDIRQERLPDKRTFKLTPLGTKALDTWLLEPDYQQERFRSGFLVKFFFAERIPREQLLAMVVKYRDENAQALETFKPMTEAIPLEYPKLTAQLGLRHLEAAVQWCDVVIAALNPKRKRKADSR
ncbi:MAG: PadR family transcriptional regulator, partial [Actinomycetota bacterium]